MAKYDPRALGDPFLKARALLVEATEILEANDRQDAGMLLDSIRDFLHEYDTSCTHESTLSTHDGVECADCHLPL